jgi:SMC interacting uncharacterized protein involved in chromosome segregation
MVKLKKKKISAKRPHLRVEQNTAISPLVRRVKQIVEKNRKFLDNVDVHAVPGIDKLSAHLASYPTELQEFHEFCLDWIEALASRANSSEEVLKKSQEDIKTQKQEAETEQAKRDKEIAKLRNRLQKLHEESQTQIDRANSLESDNVQLKVKLEETTKALDTWKVKAKAEVVVSRLFSSGREEI